jgi:hypothetical protein
MPVFLFGQGGTRSALWEIVGEDSGIIVGLLYAVTIAVSGSPAKTRSERQ